MVTWMIWFTVDLQVLLSHSHRFRALVLLGRFLDMGAWAVDLVHPAIYKLNIVWGISQFQHGCCGIILGAVVQTLCDIEVLPNQNNCLLWSGFVSGHISLRLKVASNYSN